MFQIPLAFGLTYLVGRDRLYLYLSMISSMEGFQEAKVLELKRVCSLLPFDFSTLQYLKSSTDFSISIVGFFFLVFTALLLTQIQVTSKSFEGRTLIEWALLKDSFLLLTCSCSDSVGTRNKKSQCSYYVLILLGFILDSEIYLERSCLCQKGSIIGFVLGFNNKLYMNNEMLISQEAIDCQKANLQDRIAKLQQRYNSRAPAKPRLESSSDLAGNGNRQKLISNRSAEKKAGFVQKNKNSKRKKVDKENRKTSLQKPCFGSTSKRYDRHTPSHRQKEAQNTTMSLRPTQQLGDKSIPFRNVQTRNTPRSSENVQEDLFNKRKASFNYQKIPQEKSGDLYDMMKNILDGQRLLQEEIKDIKIQTSKDISARTNIETIQPLPRQELNKSIPKLTKKQQQLTQLLNKTQTFSKKHKKPIQSSVSINRKSGALRKNCPDAFEQLIHLVKSQTNHSKRITITQLGKSTVWRNIEARIHDSEKEYQDSNHENIKHQHDQLINTNELQKKMKIGLVDRVYQLCNRQIYK